MKYSLCYVTNRDFDNIKEEFITDITSTEEMGQQMTQFLNKIGFKSYYINTWFDERKEEWVFDYGSHFNFFVLKAPKIFMTY